MFSSPAPSRRTIHIDMDDFALNLGFSCVAWLPAPCRGFFHPRFRPLSPRAAHLRTDIDPNVTRRLLDGRGCDAAA